MIGLEASACACEEGEGGGTGEDWEDRLGESLVEWGLPRETDLGLEEEGGLRSRVVPPLTPRLAMRIRSRPRSGLVSGAPSPNEALGIKGPSCWPVASYLDILDLISPTGWWIAEWLRSVDCACVVAFSRAIRSAKEVVIFGGSGIVSL